MKPARLQAFLLLWAAAALLAGFAFASNTQYACEHCRLDFAEGDEHYFRSHPVLVLQTANLPILQVAVAAVRGDRAHTCADEPRGF
ncbi:hypothetical protein PR202_ga15075 [Eleusine coracana subsp. coracana]|uniref:C2H2-type domain-containing protein n=1 Tax=Eleusine coracana subsp. coracana TaxID=191504 RepID=A0AAV5CIZ4_ELECO|nr:hypothetical protein PR202_ga15075 [Eleusine coracana subsp. coracana]